MNADKKKLELTMPTAAAFLITLCAVTLLADDMAGHYVLEGVREVGSELLLQPEGHFEYMLAVGAADYLAKGTWRRQDDAVILTSTGKEEPPFRLLRSAAAKDPGIRVWVKGPGGQPVQQIDVVVRTAAGPAHARTNEEGVAAFPDARQAGSVMFRVPVYDRQAGPFELNPAHNEFQFEINAEALAQVVFRDERLAIDGKSLVMLYWNKDQPMRYRRQ